MAKKLMTTEARLKRVERKTKKLTVKGKAAKVRKANPSAVARLKAIVSKAKIIYKKEGGKWTNAIKKASIVGKQTKFPF